MFGSSMLDIAVGVIFIFLLLSVLATAINEIIFSALNMRGKELLRGIQTLLSDPTANGLVSKVYSHGQIYGLYQGLFDPAKPADLPSYIPSRNFALALIDCVAPASESVEATPDAGVISQQFRVAAQALAADPLTEKVGKPLVAMVTMAGNDAKKLQQSVEDWFNSGMDRVSGWYKYRTQRALFLIGITMAIALNANTINIVRQLSIDPTMRQTIVAAATNAKPSQPDASKPLEAQVSDARSSFDNVQNLGIPLGWPYGPPILVRILFHPFTGSLWSTLGTSIQTTRFWQAFFGWLLTAIAISLGAPFWFDSLNKIMVIRSTVKPQEKSKDEASKS